MKKFWNFKAKGSKKAELTLYGEISDSTWWGDEVTPKQFKKDLDALGDIDELDVFINSPGGDVFAGFTIYNTLKRHKATVTAHVDGLAASAASIVCMAADKIVMPKNATMMIHNALTRAWGNKNDLRTLADELERIDGQLADIYADRCGKTAEECAALMDAETWMSGEEALALGFCDEVEENKQVAACADAEKFFAHYKHSPDYICGIDLARTPDCIGDLKTATAAKNPKPDNGGVIQPVEDNMRAQRAHFNAVKTKILEGITNA